jgi:hypothetical protein
LICGFGSEVRYIRTARSRNSSEYFLGAAMVDVPLMTPICPSVTTLRISGEPPGTEGAVNRLKKIKRQLYGRAGFELLRKMILLQ